MRVFFIVAVLFLMIGCKDREGSSAGILKQDKMQAVLWDVIGADVFTQQFIKKDSLKNPSAENMQLQNKIFAMHNVTREDFYKSYDYYVAHADLMKVILDSMSARAERDRSKMTQEHYGGKK